MKSTSKPFLTVAVTALFSMIACSTPATGREPEGSGDLVVSEGRVREIEPRRGGGKSYPLVDGTCHVVPKRAKVGEIVTFQARGKAGNGYYSYEWEGTDGLRSVYPTISKRYDTPGVKHATVRITSFHYSVVCRTSVVITK